MEILSKRKRNIYLVLLTLIFIVGTPFIILYSIGYRFDDLKLFVKTGGITIVLREPDAELYIDNEYMRNTNFLQKTYFFQSIETGDHSVTVKKPGFQEWTADVNVYPELVSETYPLMIEEKVPFIEIEPIEILESEDEEEIVNGEYTRLSNIFNDLMYVSHTDSMLSYKDLALKESKDSFIFTWNNENSQAPYYFCGIFECGKRITVRKPIFENIIAYDFYPYRDDALLLLTDSGLYVMQVDNEQHIQVFTLYNGEGIDFYIEDRERIYVKDAEKIGYLDL